MHYAVFHYKVQTIKLVEAGQEYSGMAGVSGWGYDTRIGRVRFETYSLHPV